MKRAVMAVSCLVASAAFPALAQDKVFVGQLVDYTGATEARIGVAADDKVPVISASYSGHLTDPTGKNPNTKKPAPYNFFYGASYTDACRAMVQWAAGDAKAKGIAKPKFLHTGDNHP